MGPRDAISPRGGHDDGESGNRRMFDKRTLRRMYRAHFDAAIHTFREAKSQHAAQHQLPPSGTAVFLRKRPLFEREAEDFDVITALTKGTVLHDCKLKADLKTPYIVHRTFPLPCFSESMTNDDVCAGINLPRLLQRAVDGEHVTCCMFGQTGSGKSHTMAGILSQAASLLFSGPALQRPPAFEVQLSCFEVCGANCFDLLAEGEKLVVRESSSTKVEVSAKQVPVGCSDEVLSQLQAASDNRSTSATLRNTDSSRSHAFYRVTIYCEEPVGQQQQASHSRASSAASANGATTPTARGTPGCRSSALPPSARKGTLASPQRQRQPTQTPAKGTALPAKAPATRVPTSASRTRAPPAATSTVTRARPPTRTPVEAGGGGRGPSRPTRSAALSPTRTTPSSAVRGAVPTTTGPLRGPRRPAPSPQPSPAQTPTMAAADERTIIVDMDDLPGDGMHEAGDVADALAEASIAPRPVRVTPAGASRSVPVTPLMRGGAVAASPLAAGRAAVSTPATPAAGQAGGPLVPPPPPPPMHRVERGTMTFVDLAGSERAWDSMYHDAEQRKQTAEINASLSCLKECFRVRSLQMQARTSRGASSVPRVPYRDSRLTLLLRESLQSATSAEPCVVVVATLSPCAGDTEHTLNTLRNAVTMTGMDVNHANKGEHVLEEGIAVDTGADRVLKHPSRWDVEEVRQWLATVEGGKFGGAVVNLTTATDGKAMVRFAPVRFKLLCGGDAKLGDELYKLYKEELRRANESKSKYQDGIRNLSTAPNIFA